MVLSGGTMVHALPRRPVTTTTTTPGASTSKPTSRQPQYPYVAIPPRQNTPALQPCLPSALGEDAQVLMSQLQLEDDPVIGYRQFGPIDGVTDPEEAVERVRRSIVDSWEGNKSILDSQLTVVRVDQHSVSLWVFVVASRSAPHRLAALDAFVPDNLHAIRTGRFSPRDLYPCSPSCDHPTKAACPQCPNDPPPVRNGYPTSTLLPRTSLRVPYAAFLDAFRIRFIDAVSHHQSLSTTSHSILPIARLNDGFIFGHSYPPSGWGVHWGPTQSQSLPHCYLHVALLQRRILIQPIFKTTALSPISSSTLPGSPAVLLPHGAPVHYIGAYVGPSDSLRDAFRSSLSGLGCRGWDDAGFVVCWLTISTTPTSVKPQTNSATEERGMPVVWPRRLCLISNSPTRQRLSAIPSIPSTLCVASSPPRNSTSAGGSSSAAVVSEPGRYRTKHSAKSSLRALKAFTVDITQGFDGVVTEMSSYVDLVVKEREKEKERAQRERERERNRRENSERMSSTVHLASGVILSMDPSKNRTGPSTSSAAHTPARSNSMNSTHFSLPAASGSATVNLQGFYPSPPDLDSPADMMRGHSPGATSAGFEFSPNLQMPHAKLMSNTLSANPTPPANAPDASWDESMQLDHASNRPSSSDQQMDEMGSSTGAVQNSNNAMLENSAFGDQGMGIIEDITEDDFDFFNDGFGTHANVLDGNFSAEAFLSESNNLTVDTTSAVNGMNMEGGPNSAWSSTSHDLTLPQGDAQAQLQPLTLSTTSGADAHPPKLTDPSSSLLSPAHTISEAPISPLEGLAPSVQAERAEIPPPSELPTPPAEVVDEDPLAPDFQFRTKEPSANSYGPIAFSLENIKADQKYLIPGAKYCTLKLKGSREETETETETETEQPNEIKTERWTSPKPRRPRNDRISHKRKQLRRLPLSERTRKQLEQERAKRREERRRDAIEIWHSRTFKDRYDTETDPRVAHVQRLTGRKRDPKWNPKPYLRSTDGADPRGVWKISKEFVSLLPDSDGSDGSETETSDTEQRGDGESTTAGEPDGSGTEKGDEGEDESEDTGVVKIKKTEDGAGRPSATVGNQDGRAQTPQPQDLPVGATLLHVQFEPQRLARLAGSCSLSSPGTNQMLTVMTGTNNNMANPSTSTSLPAQPISVPTPVSPAPNFAQSEEAVLMVEAAADVASREVVENSAWAESFKASFGWTTSCSSLVWANDVNAVRDLFENVTGIKAKSQLKELVDVRDAPAHSSDSKTFIPPSKVPMIAVGQRGEVLHVSSPALRFWEKLGLTPVSGSKDVVAFAFYDENDSTPEHAKILSRWIHRVSNVYSARGYGVHYVGSSTSPFSDGLVPFKWDNLKKTISLLVKDFPPEASHVVLYFVSTPQAGFTTSPAFRQFSSIISRLHRLPSGSLDNRWLFHFVPKDIVYEPRTFPTTKHLGLEAFVSSVYDRLLRKTERILPRKLFKHEALPLNRYIQAPTFTLARKLPKLSFVVADWPPASGNVVDRHSFLHVAYQLSSCNNWLFLAAVDEWGNAHSTKIWYVNAGEVEEHDRYDKVVNRVMAFAWEFSAKAKNEWNVVIARCGTMVDSELLAWEKCLHREVISQPEPIHVAITCVEHDTPLTFLTASSSTSEPKERPRYDPSTSQNKPFYDNSSNSYVLLPHHRVPLLAPNAHWLGYDGLKSDADSAIPNSSNYTSIPRPKQIGLLPLASAYIFHVPAGCDYSASPQPGSDDYTSTISSLQLHVLHTCISPSSTFRRPLRTLLQDTARSYQELALLARERWKMTKYGALPFHLIAVETMRVVMDLAKDPKL